MVVCSPARCCCFPHCRERKLQEQAQQALAECTFQPRINDKSFELQAYRPIHERLGEVLRQRHERMMRSKVVAEREQGDNTFRPRLNSRSLAMAEKIRWGLRVGRGCRGLACQLSVPRPAT